MQENVEAAIHTLDLVQSLLSAVAASLSATTGVPDSAAIFNSLLGIQKLVVVASETLEVPHA